MGKLNETKDNGKDNDKDNDKEKDKDICKVISKEKQFRLTGSMTYVKENANVLSKDIII